MRNTAFLYRIVFAFLALWFLFELVGHFPNNVLSYDVYGAYLHLPANFIYHDPFLTDWTWIESLNEKYQSTPSYYQFWYAETGRQVIKYPLGFALIYAPFFLLAHFFAPLFGFQQDGFSEPYQWAIIVGHCFYVVLGLWLARKVLLHFFSEKLSLLLLVLLFSGTNFFFTTTIMVGMPHGHLFLFYALTIIFTLRWHKQPTIKNSLNLGLVIGLAALIRASEILIVLIPLFWNIHDKPSFVKKWHWVKYNIKRVFIVFLTIIALGSIQLVYYKLATGSFFIDAYKNAGEGFDFLRPHTFQFLFSARKGWLVYTPMMLLCLLGFWVMYKQKEKQFLPFFVFTIINIYVLSSWTCWWYAESFGQRSLVQSYLILIIPLGYFLKAAYKQKNYIKYPVLGLMLGFIILNQFQTWQMHQGLLHPSRMTPIAYQSHFLKTAAIPNFEDLLLTDKSVPAFDRLAKQGHQLKESKCIRFVFKADAWTQVSTQKDTNYAGTLVNEKRIYTKELILPYPYLTEQENVIFRLEAQIYCLGNPKDILPRLVFKMRHKGNPYYDQYLLVENIETIQPYSWTPIELVFYSADVRDPTKDDVQIFGWLAGKGSFKLDDIKLSVYEGLR